MATRRQREAGGTRIDPLDRQIIARLHADGRQSNRELARYLKVPEATVRYRVNRLIASGLMAITAVIDPAALGYTVTVVVKMRVEPTQIGATAERIAALPEVSWLAITTGAYDLVLRASFTDHEELADFLTTRLAPMPGLLQSQTTLALRALKEEQDWACDLSL